jgi:hypothetical protein
MGTTRGGIYQDSTSSNVVKFNNIYIGVPFPITVGDENADAARVGDAPVADMLSETGGG